MEKSGSLCKIRRFCILACASLLGIGYLPYIPGTLGSIVGVVCAWLLGTTSLYFFLFLIGVGFLGLITSHYAEKLLGKKDPPQVIIDELFGMGVALVAIPREYLLVITGFILFRIFDITKPLKIRKVQIFPGGIGIMLDDFLAGLLTNICMHILLFFL